MDGWKEYEGKRVYVKLKNDREYNGIVISIMDKGSCIIFKLRDKFDNLVGFYDTEISVIEEQKAKFGVDDVNDEPMEVNQ